MLSKIYSNTYRNRTIENIKKFNDVSSGSEVRHKTRFKTICFLNAIGYTANEISGIIKYYNPQLENTLTHKKFVDENYIQNEVLFYSSKKRIKKETYTDKGERSDPYIPERSEVIVSPNIEARYNMIPDADANKKFFKGANIIAYGYKHEEIERYNIHGTMYKYSPRTTPYYRSIAGSDHVLFVADLDRSNFNNSLEEARLYALELKKFWSWDIIKFSGSEGFHLIKYMPKGTTVKELREIALKIDPDVNKLDWHLFNDLNWKIRGYCVNWKTGNMSEDIDLETFRGLEQ